MDDPDDLVQMEEFPLAMREKAETSFSISSTHKLHKFDKLLVAMFSL